jgi:uncharacterized protein involved in exopolysaccharide biosynthesis
MENKKQTGYNFNSVDLLIYMWNKRLVLLSVTFIAAVASIVVSMLITPMFRAAVIMYPTNSTSVAKELLIPSYVGKGSIHGFGEEDQAEQLLQILHSEPIRTRIIEKYDLMEHYEIDPNGKYPKTELMAQYNSNINFRLTEYMSVEISVMDKDPETSADIANHISNLVDTVYNSMKKARAKDAVKLVQKEYKDAEAKLAVLQDSLDILSSLLSANISDSGDPTDNLVRTLAQYGSFYMSNLTYNVRTQIGVVTNFRMRYKEARLEAEQNLPYKFVVEEAFPPEKKAYPNKSLIVIVSTFSSLLFALIILIIIDNIKARLAIREEE